jgi:hypothetical protein
MIIQMEIGLNVIMMSMIMNSIMRIQMDIGGNVNLMSNGNIIYYENSDGHIIDNRPKGSCNGKVVEIEGKRYQLNEIG